MRVRVKVIYMWLYALRHLNPLYSHVTIDDSPFMKSLLEGIPDLLLTKANISNDPTTEELLRRSTSDVAQLVSSSEDEERVLTRSLLGRRGSKSHDGQIGGGNSERRVPDTTSEGDVSDADEFESTDLASGSTKKEEADLDFLNDAEGHHAREMVSTLMPILITDSASDLNSQGVDPSVSLIAAINKAFGESSDQCDTKVSNVNDQESLEKSKPESGEY